LLKKIEPEVESSEYKEEGDADKRPLKDLEQAVSKVVYMDEER
jgi:hypothetical protein